MNGMASDFGNMKLAQISAENLKARRKNKKKFSCLICKVEFHGIDQLSEHQGSVEHENERMKHSYENNRVELREDKYDLTVVLSNPELITDGSTTAASEMTLTLSRDAKRSVRLESIHKIIDIEDLEIRLVGSSGSLTPDIEPGQSRLIHLRYRSDLPIEIEVPIVLKFSTYESKSIMFYIARSVTCFCKVENLSYEHNMGDVGEDCEFYGGEFAPVARSYACEKVRTNNNPDLPMPIIKDPYELPVELAPIEKYIALKRNGEEIQLGDEPYRLYRDIMKLFNIPLHPKNYHTKFSLMLYFEEIARKAQLLSQNLAKIRLTKLSPSLYEVVLNGLPEKRPAIGVGDRVSVREGITSPIVYQGVFATICTRSAIFRMPTKFDSVFSPTTEYSLEFSYDRRVFKIQHKSLSSVESKVKAGGASSVIFPEKFHLRECPPLMAPAVLNNLRLFNANIRNNPEQLKAVQSILTGSHRPAPFILFGPPGTGKTSTMSEAIKQVIVLQPSARILVCASSNSACDVLCEKLLQDLDPSIILRLYAANFAVEKMSPIIKDVGCHNFATGTVDFPGQERLEKYRILVTTMVSSFRFSELPLGFYTHIFIDECAFSMESETLIPIYSCLKDWVQGSAKKLQSHLILAGDIMQLGPIVSSNCCRSHLSISMMERLMEDEYGPYQRPYNETYIVKLLRNYRSHELILKVPNESFYYGELLAFADERIRNLFVGWEGLPNKRVPLIMHNCISTENRGRDSTSFFNLTEIDVLLMYIRKIFASGKSLSQNDIGVISPYTAQCRRIRHALMQRSMPAIKVGSVEEFQGQERTVILISTTRNDPNLLQSDLLKRLGFLKNPKRFNVAVTRAKSLLICVGNAAILMRDENWAKLIRFAKESGAWSGHSMEDASNGLQFIEN